MAVGGGVDRQLWERLDRVIDEALERNSAEREEFLKRHFANEPEVLTSALEVLAAIQGSAHLLEPSADSEAVSDAIAPGFVGRTFGAWRVEGSLGQGGMGLVLAVSRVEGGFEQKGALKLVALGGAEDHRRFEAERQVLAELDHPGIARLLDGGVDASGRPWMVMERIAGQPVDTWCEERTLDLIGRVSLTLDLIQAVATAHRRLVLHRDLKPSNVLVDTDGRVRVIDFGIAKRIGSAPVTEGMLPVSAPWAAPEMLTGTMPGPSVDVYGACAVLYHLATGQPPIPLDGVPVALGIGRVLDVEPARLGSHVGERKVLRDARPGLVADLEAILAKGLRKEPNERYATLESLAQDLEAALARQVVSARKGDRAYRLRRALWRARWPVAAAAGIVVALSGGLATALVQYREAAAARDAALAEETRSEAVRQSLYVILAESAESAGGDAGSREVLSRAVDRIRGEFTRTPAESARLLHALGELQFYLGNYEAAELALQPVVEIGNNSVPADVMAAAQYDMAQVAMRTGDVDQAKAMLAKAQAFWAAEPNTWRSRLIDSRLVEAQILRATDPAGAARLLEQATADHDALHGTDNRAAGVFRNNLGVTLQAAGDLAAAGQAFSAAQAIWTTIGTTETPDALNTANNLAAIATLSGKPELAEPQFAEAVRLRRKLYGDSAGTAALLNNHGKVLMQLGRLEPAQAALTEAVDMAARFAGEGSMHHVAALSGLAEVRLTRGDWVAGLQTAELAVAASQAGSAPPPAKAMALLALARAQVDNGNGAAASRTLDTAEPLVMSLGPAGARLAATASALRARVVAD